MPLTRSRKRKSLGEGSKTATPEKTLKLPNKEFGRKLGEASEFAHGIVPLVRSLRLKYKEASREQYSKPPTTPKKRLKLPEKKLGQKPIAVWTYLTTKQIAEAALCDYNEKQGTELKYVRLLAGKERDFIGPGYKINFAERYSRWKHFNFVATRLNAGPNDKPFHLFAEVYEHGKNYPFTTLSLVKPEEDISYGCQRCWTYISHPRHGFRAGFDAKAATEHKILSQQDAVKFSEFALQDYNEKHGTDLKFERALKCNSFTCEGLLMDFSKKNTSWVHMNFVAIGPKNSAPKGNILHLFAELYLEDDGKYVLAMLLPSEPSDLWAAEKWKRII
ncbi:hypothetical protein OROHE_022606 [Orobanche hederae]